MSEEHVGTVTHYFAEPQVGAVKLEGELAVGDTVHFRGHTTDFQQEVGSMEIDHEARERAGAGDHVAIKVERRVREGDHVFRISGD